MASNILAEIKGIQPTIFIFPLFISCIEKNDTALIQKAENTITEIANKSFPRSKKQIDLELILGHQINKYP